MSAYKTTQRRLFHARGDLILPTQWMSLCRHESSSRRNPFLSAVHLELRHWVAILSSTFPPALSVTSPHVIYIAAPLIDTCQNMIGAGLIDVNNLRYMRLFSKIAG